MADNHLFYLLIQMSKILQSKWSWLFFLWIKGIPILCDTIAFHYQSKNNLMTTELSILMTYCKASVCLAETTLTSQSWAKWAQWEQVSGWGPHWEMVDDVGGWWRPRILFHRAALQLGSQEPLINEWSTRINIRYTLRMKDERIFSLW